MTYLPHEPAVGGCAARTEGISEECLPSNEGSVADMPVLYGRVYEDESNNR
jgi:hypothetical protein